MKRIRRLRKGWKIFGAAILVFFLFGGYMMYANAESNVSMVLSTSAIVLEQNGSSDTIYVRDLSGTDENHITNDSTNKKPVAGHIVWTSSNNNVVSFLSDSIAGGAATTVTGDKPKIKAISAGTATVTATYYSKTYDEGGHETSSTKISETSATVTVPISVEFTDSKSNDPQNTIYNVDDNDWIMAKANTTEGNNIVVETARDKTAGLANDGVVKVAESDNKTYVKLKIVGGGSTTLTVRTNDGSGNNSLMKQYVIRSKVKFDSSLQSAGGDKYFVLDKTEFKDFVPEKVPSNLLDGALPSITNTITNPADVANKVADIKDNKILGVSAGITTLTSGVKAEDYGGGGTWYTSDSVRIVVPFKKLGNDVSNMNVGDQIQLKTSAAASDITWSTNNNNVLQVDSTTGVVTAKGAGTATITAVGGPDELTSVYGLTNKLTYNITVIDGFGLSTTSTTVNIGSSFDLEALVTNDAETYPITYKVENLPKDNGQVPTEDLVTVTQKGKVLTVSGVAAGGVKITVSQNVNGVIKSESCVVYVTTPVGEVQINPSSVSLERGEIKTVQLLFTPSGPTNDKVLWASSNESVATVTGDSYTATIKAVAGGTATITVITEDGLKVASCEVSVSERITGLTLNEQTVRGTMNDPAQFQLTATISPDGDGVNRKVTWTSSNPSVATVDENGLVKYLQPGYATIMCMTADRQYLASCEFIISIPVTEIKLDSYDKVMSIGSTYRLTAEVLPTDATNRALDWSTSNKGVATVDSNGLIMATGTGSATILCKTKDGGLTAMCNVYVKQPVTSIILNTSDITVRKGQTFWLNATCLPENADNKIVTWESRDENVVKVESDGKVTATGAGTTSVIATNTDTGLTAYCVVTVTQPVTGITLNASYQQLWVGAKYAIIPNVEPIDAENKKVTYLSSDESVATVDENGVVTALKGGSCIIEVTTDECKLTAAVTIDVKEYVSGIALSETQKFMNIGATGTLKATVSTSTATNKSIVWSSSNYDICSVDGSGNLSANNPGTAVITATAADGSGVSASCIIQVVNPVTGISVDPDTVRLLIGDSQKVTANIYPSDASIQNVTWSSSNPSVATVDESGEIFAIATGKAKITATSNDGNNITGVCWVYVTPVVNISSLKINSKEIYMLSGRSRRLTVRVRPASNTDSYEWYSTDTGIVVVDGDGVITTVGPGTADVVVESNNTGVSSTCTIHSLGISRSSIRLEQYDYYDLDVLGTDDTVTWRSSNPRVCTVDSSGHVVGRKAGTTTVTAIVNGKTLSCTVRVTNIW